MNDHLDSSPTRQETALSTPIFRKFLAAQFIANIGVWMQAIALDWVVFQLTDSAAAVGATTALLFFPSLVFGLWAGALADRVGKRPVLITTQIVCATVSITLAIVAAVGQLSPTIIYGLALINGMAVAFDQPARQSLAGDMLHDGVLANGIALNAGLYQASRLIGPAVSGVLLQHGWAVAAFAVNAAVYLPMTMLLMQWKPMPRPAPTKDQDSPEPLIHRLRKVPDVILVLVFVAVVGTFCLNFPVVLTVAAQGFGGGAALYGNFMICLAAGSILGSIVLSRFKGMPSLARVNTFLFGVGLVLICAALLERAAALMAVLVIFGCVNVIFQATCNAAVQLWIGSTHRGRVMGLYSVIYLGGTPVGAIFMGPFVENFGLTAAFILAGAAPLLASIFLFAILVSRYARSRTARISGPL